MLQASHVDEMGYIVKGHGLTAEQLATALVRCEHFEYDSCNADLEAAAPEFIQEHEVTEVWLRKRPALPNEDLGYRWYVDLCPPRARGAGRFTLVSYERA